MSGIRDAGDSALLLELEPVIDPAVNARAIAIAAAIAAERLDGVRDVVPTYRSVAVHFDPLKVDVERLRERMSRAAQSPPAQREGSLIEVPVTYGGEDGPDLQEVASFAGLTPREVIERHCAPEYRVFMLGFLPGFAYMGPVDERIAAPRKATPRVRIPAGSVGIAGRQTGVYPRPSPGGWQLIGRTSVQVFDASREPASLFAAGDRVRFILDPRTLAPANPRTPAPTNRRITGIRSVTVLKPGLLTTVQDEGRWGHQDRGVPVGGPMDWRSFHLANALVGNSRDAAALEATLLGPELRFEQTTHVALAGADLGASIDGTALPVNFTQVCKAGSVLRFGERRSGARTYIAFDGGIDVPPVLGSRATHVVSGLGGIDGRALKAGDVLALHELHETSRKPRVALRMPQGGARLRVVRGPQDDCFDDPAFQILQRTRFTISPQSDRMGYRLVGSERTRPTLAESGTRPTLAESGTLVGSERTRPTFAESGTRPAAGRRPGPSGPGTMISDATFIGGLQIPPSGDPILLMADRQTTGGYPQMATVITADLPLAGQLAPGDWIEFALCTRADAIAALKELENGV